MAEEPVSAPRGERRLLVLLFSDLVGSTELSQMIDPEDYADLLLEYQKVSRRIVLTNGGGIANYPGDGILAQFGYPIAHEDDADRSVQTGLDICRAVDLINKRNSSHLPMPIAVRVGIHAGLTVIVNPQDEERRDLALFGDAPNIASRVQSAAQPGQVLVSDEVIGLLRQEVNITEFGSPEMKGVERPIRLNLVVGAPATRTRDVRSPLIGRDAELTALRTLWAEARRGKGGGAVIVGSPGIGKSRLLTELSREVSPRSWVDLNASEMGSDSAFAGLVQLLNRTLSPTPSPEALGRAEALRDFLSLHPSPDIAVEPLLGLVLGEAPPTLQSSENAYHAIMELALHVVLVSTTEMGHAVVAIEDFHWLDPSSRAFVDRLVSAAESMFLLVVITSRPEGIDRTLDGGVNSAPVISLEPMSTAEITEVVRSNAGPGLEPSAFVAIAERAEGIPLFAEVLARNSEIRSADNLPVLLRASLLARLDRAPGRRSVAQLAAVIGTRVESELIRVATESTLESTETALDDLTLCGVLARGSRKGEHRFRHALVRDAVDSSLLRRDRQRLHLQVARALEAIGIDADHPPELLAYHLAQGGEPAQAAEQYAEAALEAARRGAYRESKHLSEIGLGLVRDQPESSALMPIELDLTMMLGNATNVVDGFGAPGLHALWKRAEELCVATDNAVEQSSAMNGQAVASMFAGDARMAVAEARRIISFGQSREDRNALVRGYSTLALQSIFLGDIDVILDSALEVLQRYRPSDFFDLTYGFGTDHGVIAHCAAAAAATYAGQGSLVRQHIDDAIALSRTLHSPTSLCLALASSGLAEILWDALGASRGHLEEAVALARTHDLSYFENLSGLFLAAVDALEGKPEAAERAQSAVTALITGGSGLATSVGWWLTALTQELAGEVASAVGTAQSALTETLASGEHAFDPELHRISIRGRSQLDQLSSDDAVRLAVGVAEEALARGAPLLAQRVLQDRSDQEQADPRCRALLSQLHPMIEPLVC